jgi:hypothetical protein
LPSRWKGVTELCTVGELDRECGATGWTTKFCTIGELERDVIGVETTIGELERDVIGVATKFCGGTGTLGDSLPVSCSSVRRPDVCIRVSKPVRTVSLGDVKGDPKEDRNDAFDRENTVGETCM